MAQSITLTASMRSNLASLKTIQGQMDTTQTRLSTGKKVNSAIDNASSYYQSRALTNRAADLDGLLDSMGQGIQTIQAANEGIEAVTSFIDQAKSVATSAFGLDASASDYTAQVKNYQEQFNDILGEISNLAKDASYQGINLLTGGNLTVMFNETRTNKLDVEGQDIVTKMANKGFDEADWLEVVDTKKTAMDAAQTTLESSAGTKTTIANQAALDAAFAPDDETPTKAVFARTDNGDGTYSYAKLTYGTAKFDSNATYFVNNDAGATISTTAYDTAAGQYKDAVKGVSDKIEESLDGISKAVDYLRDYSSELGNNFSIIETRQNFTEALIDVLETGSDNLVLADMNEESANYLALQTRQQLAINSLALASQSAQSVLSLF